MFDSMHMHMPVVIAIFAVLLLIILAGLFVAVRVIGQRVVEDERHSPSDRHPDSRL